MWAIVGNIAIGALIGLSVNLVVIIFMTRSFMKTIRDMQYHGFRVMGDIEQQVPKTSPMWPENLEDV